MATRYFLAGHRGMTGSAILRALEARRAAGEPIEVLTRGRDQLDLTDAAAVRRFLAAERPDGVILAAGHVGGQHANATYPADFIRQNLAIGLNVISAAHEADVPRLLQIGPGCIYPADPHGRIREDALLSGPLAPVNEPFAIAKIAAIKLCESYNRQHGRDYRSIVACCLYGPCDFFRPDSSHVIPSLMRRFHEAARLGAPSVTIRGDGTPRRDVLHVDDLAAAALFLLTLPEVSYRATTRPTLSHLNVGSGTDVSALELAQMIARATGFRGRILTDPTRSEDVPRRLLDTGRLTALGWRPRIGLAAGLEDTYRWFRDHVDSVRV
ncbi:GDP-L-fucose synthase family protein [Roseivivax isoporae]|uniref:GDP-L-fucose synthase n=1 Tax=Roseivivax isoporae LMG 25204 TaxID=1449351 RepID=X7F7E9_9RHOB|nr:GDP-L-fucose synthase [Roseivivax isoporae]ETX28735.1 GDP-fucose synthetase [Roseivivax isoporae LMG 25204]